MTQGLLASQLQRKLGFTRQFDKGTYRSFAGHALKRRRTPRGSITLAPPDKYLDRPAFLRLTYGKRQVLQQQVEKVLHETGLSYTLQKDLAECRLDADVAKLLYYAYRVARVTRDQLTISVACEYIDLAKAALGKPPKSHSDFWTVSRRKYRETLTSHLRTIHRNHELAPNAETRACVDQFVEYLGSWGA